MGTWVKIDKLVRKAVSPVALDEAATRKQRRRVRITVAILVAIALVFYMVLIVQILIAKMQ